MFVSVVRISGKFAYGLAFIGVLAVCACSVSKPPSPPPHPPEAGVVMLTDRTVNLTTVLPGRTSPF